jgi:hypothetical protein
MAHNGSLQVQNSRKISDNEFCYVSFMLTTEIQQDTHTGPVTLNPRWLRIPSAVKYSGLSRSRLYELLGQGRINSICLKSRNNSSRGVRLIDRESVDLFMESLQEPASRITTTEA